MLNKMLDLKYIKLDGNNRKLKHYILRNFTQNNFIKLFSVINQLDANNFCFTVSLFHASTCFEHMGSEYVEV